MHFSIFFVITHAHNLIEMCMLDATSGSHALFFLSITAEDTITISAGQVGLIGGIIGVVVVVLVVGTIALVLVVVKRRQTAGYQGAGGGPIFNMRQRFFKPRNAKVNTIA